MSKNLSGVLWRLGIFLVVCLFFLGAMFAIFAQLRFQREMVYRAEFANVSGLEEGNFVRIAGVEVGKVKQLTLRTDTTVSVEFSTDDSVVLTRGSRAVIRYNDLVGGRYLALEEGTGTTTALKPGDTIPLANTSPALDLDALIGGFRPLFRALDPDQVNALSSQLVAAFEGQGETISSFFTQTAALTNMLADRDQLIGQVVVNLNTVLGSLGDQNTQFAKAVESLSHFVSTLAERKQDISKLGGVRRRRGLVHRRPAVAISCPHPEGHHRNRPHRRNCGGRPRLLRRLPRDTSRRLSGTQQTGPVWRFLHVLHLRHSVETEWQRGATGVR